MKLPYGLAGFDSSTAMLQATALAIQGKDFPAMGHSRALQLPVRLTDKLPVGLRRSIYAAATGFEGISARSIDRVDLNKIADWTTGLYERNRYPAVFMGSSSGALVNLATALGIPWLPQTFLIALRRTGGGTDDPKGDLDQAKQAGEALVTANPDIQLHQMHDPSQDRLSLKYITYFRTKYRTLPSAYREFLKNRVEPGGTLILSEVKKCWPTTQVNDRYFFQFGAVGGMNPDEYRQPASRRISEALWGRPGALGPAATRP